ncbi:glycosyltransferase [Xanthomonas theicola]|uniref:Glycosyltransferase n=1 Tax=Xanthomonas theicola TaxID=56464 RepID=A0A2S6ZGC3_9XANT|nr:glycosyltransferase [Xanthomonas theicola]PPT91317.1 glycosyltransferase [Xanthomonas theicola]QNH26601.1 glycosyltransferase family 4 protein [Xanthomonas theicola]
MPMRLIRVISRDNGGGLSRDLHLVAETLRSSGRYRVEVLGFGTVRVVNRLHELGLALRSLLRGRADLQIFLERVYPRCLGAGRRNALVPNPEWFLSKWLRWLPRFERVLCKTGQAHQRFAALGPAATFIGFCSDDCYRPEVPRERACLHVAGRSSAKGTAVLLRAWARHPEWPRLTVVQSTKKSRPIEAENIGYLTGYLGQRELRRLQNAHRFHLCPSEVEGFGHYIMEALSVGAVVISTDGAPMNELVSAERGVLIDPVGEREDNLGVRYQVDVAGIERAMAKALALAPMQCDALGTAARTFFEMRQREFGERLQAAVADLLGDAPAPAAPAPAGAERVQVRPG